MQVVHFDTEIERAPFSWMRGPNRFLPDDIAVQWAQEVPAAFHCRAQARARRYLYVLSQSPVRPSLDSGRVGWSMHELDGEAKNVILEGFIGEGAGSGLKKSECYCW